MRRTLIHLLGIAALAASASRSAGALSLRAADLNNLVAGNSIIVVARVEGASSHWNQPGTFILTDLRLSALEVLKGRTDSVFTITQMGGTTAKFTTLIPGGAILVPGRTYLLFLRQESLPGTDRVMTVAEHCQGTFDITDRNGVLWATSQAASGDDLVSDGEGDAGETVVPGGAQGMSLDELVRSIRTLVESPITGGVK